MLHTFGAALVAATLTLAGWLGTAGTVEPSPASTPTPTPTVTPVCPPAVPVSGRVTEITATSLTITYSVMVGPPCGYDLPMTISLFTSRADADQWHAPVAQAVSGPEGYGEVTIGGLTPDTDYWFRFSDAEGRRDPYLIGGPARTRPLPVCEATVVVATRWGTGFVATVTVRNTGDEPLDGWRVSWQWSGDEQIQSVWDGVLESAGPDVTVRNAPYNGTLAPDGTTSFGLLVSTGTETGSFTPTCAR